MTWSFIWLMFVLKIPIIGLFTIVWWAVRSTDEPAPEQKVREQPRPHPHRPRRPPRPSRRPRGPHGDPASLPSPPRTSGAPAAERLPGVGVHSALSDGTLRRLVEQGELVVDPWDPGMVQPASIDLRLGDSFRVFSNHRVTAIDLREMPANLTQEVVIGPDEPFVIHPGEFCLGRTLERVELPDDVVARVEGKSSLGRLGLIVHATAGFVDPGWKGTLTLELNNLTRVPIKLYAGLPIAQLSVMALDLPAERPYGSQGLGSHYQGQVAATESRYGV